jgi:hypothetical protein
MYRWKVFSIVLFLITLCIQVQAEELLPIKQRINKLEAARAENALSAEDLLTLGRLYFFESLEDEEAIDKGYDVFNNEKLLQSSFDTKVKMYKAVLRALEARYSVWPWKKLGYVNEALEKMDTVIQQAPHDFELRLLRASVTSHLPFFFSRKTQSQQDVVLLKKQYQEVKDSLSQDVVILAQNFLKDLKIHDSINNENREG